MSWFYLLAAGLLEIGWPLGLKMSQTSGSRIWGLLIAAACMGLSGFFLWLAQRHIPMGTAYAVWTGIGAAGTLITGIVLFGDAASVARLAGVGLILSGVVLLKLAH